MIIFTSKILAVLENSPLNVHADMVLGLTSNNAHANQNLTKFAVTVPDTREQIQTYLSDLKASKVNHGKKEVLYIMWVGINPVDAIWTDAVDPDANGGKGAQHFTDSLFVNATARVRRQIQEVQYQIQRLRENHNVKKLSPMVCS